MVYFILDGEQYGDAYIKIGYSKNNLNQRVNNLQIGNPRKITLIWKLEGDKKMESKLHNLLSDFHERGEWFRFTEEVSDILDAISCVIIGSQSVDVKSIYLDKVLTIFPSIIENKEYIEEYCLAGV